MKMRMILPISISAGEDFVPAIEIAQQRDKLLVAVPGGRSISRLLKRRADKYVLIDGSQTERHKPYFYRNFLEE